MCHGASGFVTVPPDSHASSENSMPAADALFSAQEAAHFLGVATTTLYAWLAQSDQGILVIRGRTVQIDYLQGGPNGQGRIKIERRELERVKTLMRVLQVRRLPRRLRARRRTYPGITVPLGRPKE